ncbi:hypothetical protein [Spiroplasma endosymbiont of Danaus chrysippus]|uniref:hypothetical protein n=1 Tax=Spiroplasma endosymbiont of Danaus chrysippus TaxID=2691041 RepID=UPI00157B44CE|nr:hypothetical protein [Spiroplasma endosymbiont of Danaus chrysippus]
MAVGKHLITNILQKIKSQVPTLTKEDIITALNIIYITCAEYNDIDIVLLVILSNIINKKMKNLIVNCLEKICIVLCNILIKTIYTVWKVWFQLF